MGGDRSKIGGGVGGGVGGGDIGRIGKLCGLSAQEAAGVYDVLMKRAAIYARDHGVAREPVGKKMMLDFVQMVRGGSEVREALAELTGENDEADAASKVRVLNEADALTVSDAYECPRCLGNKVVYTELQTRSADEPTTVFITCVKCKYAWTT